MVRSLEYSTAIRARGGRQVLYTKRERDTWEIPYISFADELTRGIIVALSMDLKFQDIGGQILRSRLVIIYQRRLLDV